MRAYVRDLSLHEGCVLVWRSSGLWEPEATRAMARSLGIVAAFDAIEDPVPPGELAYGSLRAEGFRRTFSHAELAQVLAKLEASGASRAFVSIDSPQSFREARLLQALSEGRA